MYQVFIILHIFCASMLLALIPLGLWFRMNAKKIVGTPAELSAIATEFGIGRFLGMFGGIGLLITGGAMAGMSHYGWFDFTNYAWLAWKETVYVVILIVNFATMVPVGKKTMPLVLAKMKSGGVADDAIRAGARKAAIIGMVLNVLALVNLTLGVVK